MVAPTPPQFQSLLSVPIQANNFVAIQSVKLAVTQTSSYVTFTDWPGTLRVTAKITNSGSNGCYLASGVNSTTLAVVSSSVPLPLSGAGAVSNCDYIAAGSILTQDYIQGTLTFAAICSGSNTTTLEISAGYGQ